MPTVGVAPDGSVVGVVQTSSGQTQATLVGRLAHRRFTGTAFLAAGLSVGTRRVAVARG